MMPALQIEAARIAEHVRAEADRRHITQVHFKANELALLGQAFDIHPGVFFGEVSA